jgi:hypothetical protein
VAKHIADALREIGILLIAFAPLDITLSSSQLNPGRYLLIFLPAGILLFVGGVALEGRINAG